MESFGQILIEKLNEVRDFPRKSPEISGAQLAPDLLQHLLNSKISGPKVRFASNMDCLKRGYPLETKEAFAKRQHLEQEQMRKRKAVCEQAWSSLSEKHLLYYRVLAELGEWDFQPQQRRELKRAYRRLLLRFHPDHNPSAEAHNRTKAILEAYSFLQGDAQ